MNRGDEKTQQIVTHLKIEESEGVGAPRSGTPKFPTHYPVAVVVAFLLHWKEHRFLQLQLSRDQPKIAWPNPRDRRIHFRARSVIGYQALHCDAVQPSTAG